MARAGGRRAAASLPAVTPSRSPRARLAALLGRASLNLVDQALSALTNVVLSLLIARAVDARGFGAFSVSFLVFTLSIGLTRSLVGQPLSIRFSGADGAEGARAIGAGLGTTAVVSVASGLIAAVVGAIMGGDLGITLLAVGVVMPGLLLQDTCRMIFFSRSRPHLAVVNDFTWAVVQFASMGLLLAFGVSRPWPYVLVWGGAAAVAAAVGVSQLIPMASRPRASDLRWWVLGQRDLTGYLMLEYLLGSGSSQGSILLVGAVGSIGDVGSLRAAQTLLGPLSIVAAAVTTFTIPELSRRTGLSDRARFRVACLVSSAMLLGSTAYAGVLLLMPSSLGTRLLGDTWTGARGVLLPIAAAAVAAGVGQGPALVIYALGQARKTFRLHVVEAPLIVAAMSVGTVVGGPAGAAWGMAGVMGAMIIPWYAQLWLLLRAPQRERNGPDSTPDRLSVDSTGGS